MRSYATPLRWLWLFPIVRSGGAVAIYVLTAVLYGLTAVIPLL